MVCEPGKKACGPKFYDTRFGRVVEENNEESFSWRRERCNIVIPYIVGNNVLDLGCGLAVIADMIDDREYLGIDFSTYAVQYCKDSIENPNAEFRVGDLRILELQGKWDTVLTLELLEHVEDPAAMAQLALRHARRRVIVTVPREMKGRAHVWPEWTPNDLERMLGKLKVCTLFGGRGNDRWWLAVRDIENGF